MYSENIKLLHLDVSKYLLNKEFVNEYINGFMMEDIKVGENDYFMACNWYETYLSWQLIPASEENGDLSFPNQSVETLTCVLLFLTVLFLVPSSIWMGDGSEYAAYVWF